ncbi:MAG: inactive transglutaminase family protein [Pseudomonadota bacterium]
MRKPSHVTALAAVLMALGVALFAYKATNFGIPLKPEVEAPVWTVEARLSFRSSQGPVKASLKIPHESRGFGILDENFVSRGFGLTTAVNGDNREAMWAIRRSRGPQALYYRVSVFQDPARDVEASAPPFPAVPSLEEPYATALEQLVASARARSADIATFTAEMLRMLADDTPDENVHLFLDSGASSSKKAEVAKTLLAGARIPTRIAHGLELSDTVQAAGLSTWLEVHNGDRWLSFALDSGTQFQPTRRLVWYYGSGKLMSVQGGRGAETIFSVQRSTIGGLEVAERRAAQQDSHVFEFSLFDLPIRTQAVYSVLLMIPVGALVMVLMRNVVGVPTFGTFTPILIALAFRETRLLYGIVLFSLVIALGLAVRFYLEKLRLLLAPRLASVLTVVVLMLAIISVLSHRLELETGLSVALFPMVILTMVIERMSIVWDERGPGAAATEGLGTLAVAIVAYVVMSIDQLEHLVFVFPELLLVMLGVMLMLGRYTGYRLSELVRFKTLADRPK